MEAAYRICFVCTGNICRSPAAEVVVRALAERAGRPEIAVDSAGTGNWHVGQPADPRALRALSAAGYDGRAHRARVFEPGWFRQRELIVALDRGARPAAAVLGAGRRDARPDPVAALVRPGDRGGRRSAADRRGRSLLRR